jgi:hypothetical protein
MNFATKTRRSLLAGGAALLLATTAIGVAGAQTATPGAATGASARPTHQQYIDALAQKLGVTSDKLTQAMTDARTQLGIPDRGGLGGPGGPGRGGPGGGFGRGADGTVIAGVLGITPEQLRTELPGKSLSQVAQAHGKTAADVANALKAEANKRVDAAVTAGRLTADQAAQAKTRSATQIDELVNKVTPAAGQAGPRQRTPGAPGAPRQPGASPSGTPSATTQRV